MKDRTNATAGARTKPGSVRQQDSSRAAGIDGTPRGTSGDHQLVLWREADASKHPTCLVTPQEVAPGVTVTALGLDTVRLAAPIRSVRGIRCDRLVDVESGVVYEGKWHRHESCRVIDLGWARVGLVYPPKRALARPFVWVEAAASELAQHLERRLVHPSEIHDLAVVGDRLAT